VVQKPQEVDPRFEGHCSLVTLVRPDHTRHIVSALRDTGASQSLVSQQSVSDCNYESTGEFRLIRGVTGETVSVPLVRVTLQSSLCSGGFLCGLATSLPTGIDVLLGNDLCPGAPAVDAAVVTRSQTVALRNGAELQTPLVSEPEISPVEAESDSVDKLVEADLASLFESSAAVETIPDVLVQSPVIEEIECPATTSLPTSAPMVETLLSKAEGQLTSTQTGDLTALLDDFGDVFSNVPGRTTLGVHHIELKPDTKPIRLCVCLHGHLCVCLHGCMRACVPSEYTNALSYLNIIDLEVFNRMQKLSACASVYPECVFVTENKS